jgi:hypothetical protein
LEKVLRELFVHIGSHKTGSTSIQSSLYLASKDISNKDFFYPNITGAGHGWYAEIGRTAGNASLADADATIWRGVSSRLDRWEILLNEALPQSTQSKTVILSSENLSYLAKDPNFWRILEEKARRFGFIPHVILYLRNPFDLLISMYGQAVKSHGEVRSLSDYTQEVFFAHSWWQYVIYEDIDSCVELAKTTEVDFRIYRFEEHRNNICSHFFEQGCGLNVNYPRASVQNRSISARDVDFLRGINLKSIELGRILGWEATERHFNEGLRRGEIATKFHLTVEAEKDFRRKSDDYRERLQKVVSFGDNVDYGLSKDKYVNQLEISERSLREELISKGSFVAASYSKGYLHQQFKNDS